MEQRGSCSSDTTVDLDILQLSQQLESQRTIRNGDTPAQGLQKGQRPALVPIPSNVAAWATVNPFSFTAQRQKAALTRLPVHGEKKPQEQQQQQQPSVRFNVVIPASSSPHSGDAANPVPVPSAPAATTPASMLPATANKAAASGCNETGASGGSPSPYVLFRGRLNFATEADSARKFDRPATASKRATATLKRKLLISPGGDMTAAFPSLVKPAVKQRRHSLGHAGPSRATHAASAAATEAGDVDGLAAAGTTADGASLGKYWSDPLPLPVMATGCVEAAVYEDMQDTAASPCSSGSGGECIQLCGAAEGMGDCCGPVEKPAYSPLPWLGQQQNSLPTVEQPDCGFPSITPKAMRDLLTLGAAAFGLSSFVVVDCRYDYEFEGGRLPGALHLSTPEEVTSFLQQPREDPDFWQHTALIFHCEFSTERGPRAAKWVRNQDRAAHLHDYPALSHPHVFVLQGGYKAFWRAFPEFCEGGYRPMDHPDFTEQLKVCHHAVKKAWAMTTRTYSSKQRQRRPSYRLRQSTGAAVGSSREHEAAAAEATMAVAEEKALPPGIVAAQHEMHPR